MAVFRCMVVCLLRMLFLFCVLFKGLVIFLFLALGVGFYTLIERKVLGYIQVRKGPNKVGIVGLPQPLSDALKLFLKEVSNISLSNKLVYIFSPVFAVVVMFVLWGLYVSSYGLVSFKLGILFFLCVSSLNVYTVLMSGWSSNSKYALLGAVRSVAQTISYEVTMALILILVIFTSVSFDFVGIAAGQSVF